MEFESSKLFKKEFIDPELCTQIKAEPQDHVQSNAQLDITIKNEIKDLKEELFDIDSEELTDVLQCHICKRNFLILSELEEHINQPTSKRIFTCAYDKCFRDMFQLRIHYRKHTGEKPYECVICKKQFSINGNLNKHMRLHTGDKPFACHLCERKFTQYVHLENHTQAHSSEFAFVCGKCERPFKTKSQVHKHMKSHYVILKKPRSNVICQVCLKTLSNAKELAQHMDEHLDTKHLIICSMCGKKFEDYLSHFYHLRSKHRNHPSLHLYKCDLCSKSFKSKSHLQRHIKVHTGEKPHVCKTCNRGFSSIENLNRHIRVHTGEKPYPCLTCGRGFAHSTTVKEHIRIHTEEKPFGCSICHKKFDLKKILNRHIRCQHPDTLDINPKKNPIQFVNVKHECDNENNNK